MKPIFNKGNRGSIEINEHLSFLNADYDYKKIETDINLRIKDIVDIIGQSVYDKIADYYANPSPSDAQMPPIIKLLQLSILCLAVVDHQSNRDLSHDNNGRHVVEDSGQKRPYKWQVEKDDMANMRRGYKALDQLLLLLDASGYTEWTDSDQYKKARSLFIYNTDQFDAVYFIDKSGQLYYRMIHLMANYEETHVCAILGETLYQALKGRILDQTTNADDRALLKHIQRPIAYFAMAKASIQFGLEILPISMYESLKPSNAKANARAEYSQHLHADAKQYLTRLQEEVAKLHNTETETDLLFHFGDDACDEKHINV